MQIFQGTLVRLMLILFAIFGLYAMKYVIVPGGFPLPGLQQWVLPSLPGSSSQQRLPASMFIYSTLVAPSDATNFTTLLLLDNKTIGFKDHDIAMTTPSKSDTKDLGQSLLKTKFPGVTNASSSSKQEFEGEKRSSGKEGAILQGDDDPLPGGIQDDGLEEKNVSTASNDDLGFHIEDTSAWVRLEEHMSNNNNPATSHSSAELQEEEKVLKAGNGKTETAGIQIPSLSSTSSSTTTSTPPPPSQFHNGTIKVGSVPWLPKVAALLSKCASTAPFRMFEYKANNPCPRNCSGNGVCNYDRAKCRCFHGYTGAACDLDKDFECNMKSPSDVVKHLAMFGPWVPSICSTSCDKRKGFCYCGEGSKYPKRPAAEQCGFPKIVGTNFNFDWTVGDPDIFTKDNGRPGWCNVDPAEYYGGRAQKKENCYCVYDGTAGELCEHHTHSTCMNQCSGNGFCRSGFCACEEGWYGIDCSIPSVKASMKTWPSWLSSDRVGGDNHQLSKVYLESNKISVERHRPLIYVYDLPAKFNNLLLEGRHFKFHCVNRVYDAMNQTMWAEALYGAENAFIESLLASEHRTNNAEEADFFYVPVFGACAIARAGDSPHMDVQRKHYGIRPYFAGDIYYKQAYQHIRKEYPYWDRYDGRDHIWMFPWDEGACVCPKEIWNSMMLVHWGNTNSKYNYSTTAYGSDNWKIVPKYWRGNHPCYYPEKDLVLPSWKNPDVYLLSQRLWTRYSMGIRQRVADEFGTEPNLEGRVGRQFSPDVKVFNVHSEYYSLELASSRFCGVFPGDGWSGRLEDSVLHGCIPVIIQDGIDLPFENVLDYSKFAVRIIEKHLPLMVDILRSIPEEKVNEMQSVVQTLWQRFTYHNSIRLEADRQELLGKSRFSSWTAFKDLRDDDAFDTFIQVLRFKLTQRASETTSNQRQNDRSANCYNYSYDLK